MTLAHKIALIYGDGIGPEVTQAAVGCIEATGVAVEWERVLVGEEALQKYGSVLPEEAKATLKRSRLALKGPVSTPIGGGFRSVNVQMRQELDLYACVRPCRSYAGVRAPYQNVDLIIIRENTEDLYAGIEFEEGKEDTRNLLRRITELSAKKIRPDSAISIKPISVTGTRRIARFAFEYALSHGRKKVTCVQKANIMKFTDGLFLKTAREVARDYQGRIDFEERLVDNMCMQLVLKPQDYDCLVLPNLYGDIISDLCAGLVGGLGVAPGANIGDECAIFEPTHGSAPKYKGKNKVNPAAMILSGVMMLNYIGEQDAAGRLEKAVAEVLKEGKTVTYDLKENRDDPQAAGTREMAEAIIKKLK